MGVTKLAYECLLGTLDKNVSDIKNKNYLELGIQNFSGAEFRNNFLREVICEKFNQCISLDLHNNNGVTICDLSIFHDKLFSSDVITNFGTSEHVEYLEGQYNCWKNIHSWLNMDGIVIHEIPEDGSWKNHCRYYTNYDFYKNLENYGYEILEFDQHVDSNGNLNWCVLKKISNPDFMSYDEFFKYIKVDYSVNIGGSHINNNPKNLK